MGPRMASDNLQHQQQQLLITLPGLGWAKPSITRSIISRTSSDIIKNCSTLQKLSEA